MIQKLVLLSSFSFRKESGGLSGLYQLALNGVKDEFISDSHNLICTSIYILS